MKKTLFSLLLLLLPAAMMAQEDAPAAAISLRFAWYSEAEVMKSMPEYAAAGRSLDSLKAEFAREAKRSADDFAQKYEEFLDQQRTLAPSIRTKRQAELQELMNQNIAFKAEGERLIERAGHRLYAPVKHRLRAVVAQLAQKHGYAFVLNSDNDALPYADPTQGEDITQALKEALNSER